MTQFLLITIVEKNSIELKSKAFPPDLLKSKFDNFLPYSQYKFQYGNSIQSLVKLNRKKGR